MKKSCKLSLLSLIAVAAITTVLLPLPAFSGGPAPEEESNIGVDDLVICTEPRPQICTMDYKPVCGQLQDGSFKTYSNGCGSCSDPEVVGYREGECAADK